MPQTEGKLYSAEIHVFCFLLSFLRLKSSLVFLLAALTAHRTSLTCPLLVFWEKQLNDCWNPHDNPFLIAFMLIHQIMDVVMQAVFFWLLLKGLLICVMNSALKTALHKAFFFNIYNLVHIVDETQDYLGCLRMLQLPGRLTVMRQPGSIGWTWIRSHFKGHGRLSTGNQRNMLVTLLVFYYMCFLRQYCNRWQHRSCKVALKMQKHPCLQLLRQCRILPTLIELADWSPTTFGPDLNHL